jgi:hypothetical protein
MNCEQARARLLDLVYDELPDGAERAALHGHVAGCPACRTELEELGVTRRFLAAWDDAPPAAAPALPNRRTPAAARPLLHFPRISWLTAAAAILVIAAGVLVATTPVRLSYHDNVLAIQFGRATASPAADAEMMRTVDRLIAESEARQMNRFMDALQNVNYHLEEERYRDRQAIQQGFDLVKEIYMDQIERNNQFLELSLQQADYRTRIQPR